MGNSATPTLTFNLGRNALIGRLALWNLTNNASIREFELFADTNENRNDGLGQSLGRFEANNQAVCGSFLVKVAA